MSTLKVVFLGYEQEHEVERVKLKAPENIEVVPVHREAPESEVDAVLKDADVIVPWRMPLTLDHARKAPKLKLVQALSAGVDYLPVAELAEMGIRVANNGGANSVAVAEVAVWLIVTFYRDLETQLRQLRAGRYAEGFFERWTEFNELAGKRVGIVGLGHIGFDVARRLAGWDCELVYYDILPMPPERERAAGVRRVEFDELLRTSDIVTLHVPLTKRNRGLVGRRELDLMKETAVLINTGRGGVINEAALIDALRAGSIRGAALDVTEVEPIEMDNPLLQLDNVVLLPHFAGGSMEAREKALDFAVRNAGRLAAGEDPESIVTPE
ncbi:MAG: lactate dehydrogenase [Chloroflexi bacterium]|nr:lactate dehydrogenase [Chloroflexota bacterium]